jgi:hypothetical protein
VFRGGHTDFVKAVLCARVPVKYSGDGNSEYGSGGSGGGGGGGGGSGGGGGGAYTDLLVSGGADARIVVWRLASGEKLFALTGHARGVLDLALDPFSPALTAAGRAYDDDDDNDDGEGNDGDGGDGGDGVGGGGGQVEEEGDGKLRTREGNVPLPPWPLTPARSRQNRQSCQ